MSSVCSSIHCLGRPPQSSRTLSASPPSMFVRKSGRGPGLGKELTLPLFIRELIGGQRFYRDAAIEASVMRTIDLAHAAGTDRGHDFVRADSSARGETHF